MSAWLLRRGVTQLAPSPLVVNLFSHYASAIYDTALEWNTGEQKGWEDSTGDIALLEWSGTTIQLSTAQNRSTTITPVATMTSQSVSRTFCCAVDSTGLVHVFLAGTNPDTKMYYGRLVITRSGGHITGFSWDVSPFALPDHSHRGIDFRQDIKVLTLNGVERVNIAYGSDTGSGDNWQVYGLKSKSITPATAADFAGWNNSGSDQTLYSTSGTSVRINHQCHALFAQVKANSLLCLFLPRFLGDYSQGGNSPGTDLTCQLYVANGTTGWDASGSPFVIDNGTTVEPEIMDACSTQNAAYLLYVKSDSSVRVGKVDASGTFSDVVTLSTGTNRSGMGCLQVLDNGKFWSTVITFGVLGVSPLVKHYFWDGVTLTTTSDSATWGSAPYANKIEALGIIRLSNGLWAVRFNGDVGAQAANGKDLASTYGGN